MRTTSTPRCANVVAAVRPPTPPPTTRTRRIVLLIHSVPCRAFPRPTLVFAHRKLRLLDQSKCGASVGRHFANGAQIALAGKDDIAVAPAQSRNEIADRFLEAGPRNDL